MGTRVLIKWPSTMSTHLLLLKFDFYCDVIWRDRKAPTAQDIRSEATRFRVGR